MPDIGFLNGRFMALEDVKISVEDRGFQFGDGVYEVVRTYGGAPFRLREHLQRLQRSVHALALPMPFTLDEWSDVVLEGVKRAGYPEHKIYIQITRGVSPRDHAFPGHRDATCVMTVRELHELDAALRRSGVSAMTTPDLRWGRCDIKSLNLLPNVLARQQAKEAGVFEAVFVRDHIVTEGSVSNVMMVSNGRLCTAPEDARILSGVTRNLVLDLARKAGIGVQERDILLDELRNADEALLTGTTVEVLPLVRLDGHSIGAGTPGPLTARLAELFTGGRA
jgi:D-alanine transaminase